MLMDPMGGIVMTNDGNAILREVKLLIISTCEVLSSLIVPDVVITAFNMYACRLAA